MYFLKPFVWLSVRSVKFDKKNGARPLNRMIQKYVEDLIAENLVSDKIKAGDKLYVDHKPDQDNLILLINKKEIASWKF